MITYELLILYRILPKAELKTVLRRTADVIFDKGGIIRKIDNLGTRDMPHKTSSHGAVHHKASYYLYEFNVPPRTVETILDEFNRDVDVVRRRIYKKMEPESFECTLHEELQPPPYRKSVQDLVAQARKLDKPKFRYNEKLDYYPFQK